VANKKPQNPAEFIFPLDMNGLSGRMLHMPAPKRYKREILVIYGHHALIERWWGLIENLNDFGAVTMPDLPGFGSMDAFQKIGKKPTIDNFADYLASFIKLRYKKRRLTIIGISFGFVVATRMLQRYPELAKKVDLVVSIVGFTHCEDFTFKPRNRRIYGRITKLFSTRPVSFVIRYAALNRFVINQGYLRLPAGRRRFLDMDPETFKSMIDFDVELWQRNDVRTHWATTNEFLKLDNCTSQVGLPLWHVASSHDPYFDIHTVEQHMRIVFGEYHQAIMNSKAHTPHILGDKKELAVMIPTALRRELRKQP